MVGWFLWFIKHLGLFYANFFFPFSNCTFQLYHHHVVPLAWISLILSRHFSLSFIASGRSSGLHPVSSHSCWIYFCAGCPAFAWPYVGLHRSTSLMRSSLLLQQCPACLVLQKSIISAPVGLFYTKIGLKIRLSNYICHKNLSCQILLGYFMPKSV